ncbi:MAG: hypothetical protein IPM23_07715 [Candidatus Melainabacteria bacterium]|nr:hypothetical protein [Candidatus Melainabacteria bacterium]
MKRQVRSNEGAALTAEFAPALFVFFLIILFPLINLIGMATGASVVYFVAGQTAISAGNAASYASALDQVQSTANTLTSSGFGQFARLQPVGGYNGCGVDLYTTQTSVTSSNVVTSEPNTPLAVNPDTSNNLYSYDTVATYDVGPFVNMGAMPFIGGIPGVGRPARLTFSASRNIEHPDGLTGIGSVSNPPAGGSDPPSGGIGVTTPNPGGGGGPTVIPPGSGGGPTGGGNSNPGGGGGPTSLPPGSGITGGGIGSDPGGGGGPESAGQ